MPITCQSCCGHVTKLQGSISRSSSRRPSVVRGMALRVFALLAVLIVTTQHTQARPSQREAQQMMYAMEPEPAENSYDQSDQHGSHEMANLMYQMLQHAAQQQQQQQQQEHLEEVEQDSNPLPPEAEFQNIAESLAAADKRGSYMSLCHFKICNMGRKRNLRKSQWSRF